MQDPKETNSYATMPHMFKAAPSWINVARWTILGLLLVIAAINQYNFSIKPFILASHDIPAMAGKDDAQKLQVLAPDLFALVQAVNALPPRTRVYFVPCFDDSGNTGRWWWYVHLITRYFAYPRLVLCHQKLLYDNNKATFLACYIGKARTWKEIDWIRSNDIQAIILMRHNKVELLTPSEPIGTL